MCKEKTYDRRHSVRDGQGITLLSIHHLGGHSRCRVPVLYLASGLPVTMTTQRKVLAEGWWVITELWLEVKTLYLEHKEGMLSVADVVGDLALIAAILVSLLVAVARFS